MSDENIITSANQVEVVLERSGTKRGTSPSMGRIVVDEYEISRTEDDSLGSGVGQRLPAGIIYGDIEFEWSFTLLGDDTRVFQMIATRDGKSVPFSMTARKTDENGTLQWEVGVDFCVATSDASSASSGDAHEVPVEGIAANYERIAG